MQVRCRFLGTSGAWAIPRPGCLCRQCRSEDPRDRRTRSSILVENLLIDCGTDFSGQWASSSFPQIRNILLTHGHHDHLLGLRELCPEYGPLPWGSCTVWALEETLGAVREIHGELPLSFNAVEPFAAFEVEGLRVELIPVRHSPAKEAAGILIEDLLFYAPDMKELPEKSRVRLEGVDTAVLDGSIPDGELANHQSMIDGVELAHSLGINRLFFTHIGHSGLTTRELKEKFLYCPAHHVAWDGLTVLVGR